VKRTDSSLGAIGLLTWPALAFAEDPAGAADPHAAAAVETAEHAAAGHAAETAHASPNLFSVDPGLLIWTILTFLDV
jgi:hypothetical protein